MVAGRRKCMSAEKDKNCRHWQGCAPLLRLPLRSGCSFVRNLMAILHLCESSHATARMPVVDLRVVHAIQITLGPSAHRSRGTERCSLQVLHRTRYITAFYNDSNYPSVYIA